MCDDDLIRANASITLLCGICTRSHTRCSLISHQCHVQQHFCLLIFSVKAEDVQLSERARKGMSYFHVNSNKAAIVLPSLSF